MGVIINTIGVIVCGIVLYAWVESEFKRNSPKKSREDAEKKAWATKDLIRAINERKPREFK